MHAYLVPKNNSLPCVKREKSYRSTFINGDVFRRELCLPSSFSCSSVHSELRKKGILKHLAALSHKQFTFTSQNVEFNYKLEQRQFVLFQCFVIQSPKHFL